MALTRPTLLATSAFDATKKHMFYFNVIGGSQVVKNRLIIRDNSTNTVVYDKTQETFRFEHTVDPDESLVNGKYYNAVVITFDIKGNQSASSTPIQFWCYSEPKIEFTNIPTNHIIPNASFNFSFSYNQAEKEKLNSYQMNLYNAYSSLIATSGDIYVSDGTPLYTGEYLFAGFENKTIYFIEIIGQTVEGTEITTGLIRISVDYIRPDLFTLVELTNNCEEGYINIESNLVLIEGTSNPHPPKYIENKEIDLTGADNWVKYESGYSISDDFLAKLWFRKPNMHNEIFRFTNAKGQTIVINIRKGYETESSLVQKVYAEVYVTSVINSQYYIFSNYISQLSDSEYYFVWLKRKNNIYEIRISDANSIKIKKEE